VAFAGGFCGVHIVGRLGVGVAVMDGEFKPWERGIIRSIMWVAMLQCVAIYGGMIFHAIFGDQ